MCSGGDDFVPRNRTGVKESLHRRLAKTPAPLMWPFLVVAPDPFIKIGLVPAGSRGREMPMTAAGFRGLLAREPSWWNDTPACGYGSSGCYRFSPFLFCISC